MGTGEVCHVGRAGILPARVWRRVRGLICVRARAYIVMVGSAFLERAMRVVNGNGTNAECSQGYHGLYKSYLPAPVLRVVTCVLAGGGERTPTRTLFLVAVGNTQ